MVKKKDSSPLLDEDEVESLVKSSIKREKKKLPEKIIPLPMENPTPKPVKKEVKKEQDKIVKAIKNLEPPKPEIKFEVVKTPEIEYEFKRVTKFDLNWYYVKEKFVMFKRWLFTPYRLYSDWFNKKFNLPSKKDIDELLELMEDLPKMEQQIKEEYKPNISKLMEHHSLKIPEVKEDISMKEIEKIFDEMKPVMIKQIYENINRENKQRIRKLIIKGVEP
jgi:hypothetical protein